jgi:hypothetical protein
LSDADQRSAFRSEAMRDTKAVRIAYMMYAGGYVLQIEWSNGKVMFVDLQEPISRVEGMSPLRVKEVFAEAKKGEGGHSIDGPARLTWALIGFGN